MAPATPWVCASCGDLVPAGKTSCPSCARAVNEMSRDVVGCGGQPVVETESCPRCGGRVVPGTHVCSRCGADDRTPAWRVVGDEPEESESEVDEETEVALTRPHLDDEEYDEYLSREFGMKRPKRGSESSDAGFEPSPPSRTSLLLIGLLVLGVAVLLGLLTGRK